MSRWCACLAVVVLFCVAAPVANAAIYWGYDSTIGLADLDGSNPHYDLLPNTNEARDTACGVAVNEKHLFWAGFYGIGTVDLETRASNPRFIGGVQACGIAANASHVFWGSQSQKSSLSRARVDGSEVIPSLVNGVEPCAIATQGEYVYWVGRTSGRIGRAHTDGSEVDSTFLVPWLTDCALAVDDRFVYWAEAGAGAIGRAPLDGGEAERGFITGLGRVTGLATNATHIYWTESNSEGFSGAVGRAGLDGTDVNRTLITTPRPEIGGIAVDARPGSLPRVAQSQPIRFGRVKHIRSSGTVFLAVDVAAPGRMHLGRGEIRWTVIKGKARLGPQRWQLKIWPGGSGAFAAKTAAKLKRTGRATVELFVTFREPEHWPVTVTKRVTLVQQKKVRRARR